MGEDVRDGRRIYPDEGGGGMKFQITTLNSSNLTGKMKLNGAVVLLIPESMTERIIFQFLLDNAERIIFQIDDSRYSYDGRSSFNEAD